MYAPLFNKSTEDEYWLHYRENYVEKTIKTFDGIEVNFTSGNFNHLFKESSSRSSATYKDQFAWTRAQRINWIAKALADDCAELFFGWNSDKKEIDDSRRICLVDVNYIVVIRLMSATEAKIVTAYTLDSADGLRKLKESEPWEMPERFLKSST